METATFTHSFPFSPQWGQYCTLRGCNLNRRRVIQCYTVTLWDFIVVVQYSLMAMLADERYIGEEKTIKIKKRRMKLSIERGVKISVGTSESRWNLWFLLYIVPSRLDKKRFHMLATHTCRHTLAHIHSAEQHPFVFVLQQTKKLPIKTNRPKNK